MPSELEVIEAKEKKCEECVNKLKEIFRSIDGRLEKELNNSTKVMGYFRDEMPKLLDNDIRIRKDFNEYVFQTKGILENLNERIILIEKLLEPKSQERGN